MPIGAFLDSLPKSLFIGTHIVLLLIGLWVAKQAMEKKLKYASAFWLYIVSQVVFLTVFWGLLTLKMGVLLEQILVLIMVLWIAMKSERSM